ncbi:DUF4865 family protein [Taklimakanibacter deserti]|uniref:DUF4865 family protein n=1 Tax=Taklimakanibacter deserti TaxID=2267839 RepID=UPI000E64DEB8
MLAMEYSFTLPADYDMAIIERRIRDKGPMLDGFPLLRFKAYLSAKKKDGSAENLYAPFYVWDHPDGMSNFLTGPGFAALTRDFGWPRVATWTVWHAKLAKDLSVTRFASREITAIAPYSDLAALRQATTEAASIASDALADVVGFDPTAWTLVRFRLWRELPKALAGDAQLYDVGHISLP